MTQYTQHLMRRGFITLFALLALAINSVGKDDTDFSRIPGMYFVTWDAKQAFLPQSAISDEMRKHINSARWPKGQHKLPQYLTGWRFDLDKDGADEVILDTGSPYGSSLVLRIQGGRAEIVGAFNGSFGLIRREKHWDDIVVFSFADRQHKARDGLRFDGKKYSRIWRHVEGDQEQAKEGNEHADADKSATGPESKAKIEEKPETQLKVPSGSSERDIGTDKLPPRP